MSKEKRTEITAIKVNQWSYEWDKVQWNPALHQSQPERKHFFLFSVEARLLKRLTGIQRRSTDLHESRKDDLGIQRFHDADRSKTIRDFVRYGYPWSELPKAKRDAPAFSRFHKPGWLPTGIIVNILGPRASRGEQSVHPSNLIDVKDIDNGLAHLVLPASAEQTSWQPSDLHPIEVIDGQHRLWAFDEDSPANFELPVIAFYDLDISWQAYLFWSINITPKRINKSLAFDLYPLLRTEDWLDESLGGHRVYRETRAQELVESLYAHPDSPWFKRINMLGQTKAQSDDPRPMVTQNAWVSALLATLVKNWEAKRSGTGGLFGSSDDAAHSVLQWNKSQQAALLILLWQEIRDAVSKAKGDWVEALRADQPSGNPAFESPYSLLTSDQGVRGVLALINDLCYIDADRLVLDRWKMEEVSEGYNEAAVSEALYLIDKQPVAGFLRAIARELAHYDWRSSSAPGLTPEQQRSKTALRGGSGYRVLRNDLVSLLATASGAVGVAARRLAKLNEAS